MELSSQMLLFARVVDSKSFSAAARDLGQTPSSVSRQMAQLEDKIGVKLLHRSTSGLALTPEGEAFFQRCAEVRDRIADAETFAVSMNEEPRGTLRIAATVAFAKAQLLPVMPAFMECYPELRMQLELTDRPVDLMKGDIDVAIRFTEQLDRESVIARKLAANTRVICASPDYIRKSGMPETAADLPNHNCLQLSTVKSWNDWHLDGYSETLNGNFSASSADGIYHATLAGLGLARLSLYLVAKDLRTGRLIRVLPDYVHHGSDIVAIYADKRNLAPRIRVFVDFLVEHFKNGRRWSEIEDVC